MNNYHQLAMENENKNILYIPFRTLIGKMVFVPLIISLAADFFGGFAIYDGVLRQKNGEIIAGSVVLAVSGVLMYIFLCLYFNRLQILCKNHTISVYANPFFPVMRKEYAASSIRSIFISRPVAVPTNLSRFKKAQTITNYELRISTEGRKSSQVIAIFTNMEDGKRMKDFIEKNVEEIKCKVQLGSLVNNFQ